MDVSITALYAGLSGLLLLALAGLVTLARYREGVDLGDGGRERLQLAIRVHGNAAEYLPLALLLLLALELAGGAPWLLHAAGIALVAGRVLHAWGLSRTRHRSPGRFLGIVLTWASVLVLSLGNLWIAL